MTREELLIEQIEAATTAFVGEVARLLREYRRDVEASGHPITSADALVRHDHREIFVRTRCVTGKGRVAHPAALYEEYAAWARSIGVEAVDGKRNFLRWLRRRYPRLRTRRIGTKRYLDGIEVVKPLFPSQ